MSCGRSFSLLRMAAALALLVGPLSTWTSPLRAAEKDAKAPIQIMVIASLHSRHANNPDYSYERLYAIVAGFVPDRIGLEIRQEDLARGADYLARNYPLEMRELAERYQRRAVGIDWLGSDLEGRAIPPDYWSQESGIKRLQRELDREGGMTTPRLEAAAKRQSDALAEATPEMLDRGLYDAATRDYYSALAEAFAGSRYEQLSRFYAERDRRIGENASRVIEACLARRTPARRIVFVVGADHHGSLVSALQQRFASSIELVPAR